MGKNATEVYQVELPWFDSVLMPNNTSHWRKKHKARQAQKMLAYYMTSTAPPKADTYRLDITFCQPTGHSRDLDNCIASIKGFFDGLALAWDVNDKQFKPITADFGETGQPGKIIIRVNN